MKRKILWGVIALIVLGAGSYFGYEQWFKAGETTSTSAQIQTVEVQRGDIISTVSGSGSIDSMERETLYPLEESAEIDEIMVEEGDVVHKGDVLFTFVTEDKTSEIEEQLQNIESYQYQLDKLKTEFKEAVRDGEEVDTDDYQFDIDELEFKIKQAQEEIEDLMEEQEEIEPLLAPIDGTITSIDVQEGQYVSENTTLGEMVNYEALEVSIEVDELDIGKLEIGQPATVTLDALEDQTIEGVVTEIGDEGTSTNGVSVFSVAVQLLSVENVKVGMSASAEITIETKEDVLMIPIEAIQQMGDSEVVFLATEEASDTEGEETRSRGDVREVETGIYNESMIEIVSGLSEGEEVVIPTIVSTSNDTEQEMGPGGMGGFPGSTGGFTGGGGGMRSGGGGGMR